MTPTPQEMQKLLNGFAQGDSAATESLFSVVYDELHRLASNLMRSERQDHTLQATALIHEAFVRLAGTQENVDSRNKTLPQFNSQAHFVAIAAKVMRQILVNHAVAKNTQKRGGERRRVNACLEEVAAKFDQSAVDLLALDDALTKLEHLDSDQYRLVELRFFAGQSVAQCAEILGISERSAYYEWAHAKAWLRSAIDSSIPD